MNVEQNFPADKPLNICVIGNHVLREKTKSITVFDDELFDFVKKMLRCMYDNNGIGLAAPQVGQSKKICVIDVSPCLSDGDSCTMDGSQNVDIRKIMPLFMINPAITEESAETSDEMEGCLSVPDFSASVRRPSTVTVQFMDIHAQKHSITANAILARCMQHEIDHLNGRLYTDLIGKTDKLRLAKYLSEHAD